MFVDGRYSLQARAQVDTPLFEVLQVPEAKASKWLVSKLAEGATVGYDPRLHTIKEIKRLTETLGKSGIRLEPQATNPIDVLWQRPARAPCRAVGAAWARIRRAEREGQDRRACRRC